MTYEIIDRVGVQGMGQFPMTDEQYAELHKDDTPEMKAAREAAIYSALEHAATADEPPQGVFNRVFGWLMRVVTRREYGQ